MHLPRDLQTQVLQALLRPAGLGQAGLLARPHRGAYGNEEKAHHGLEYQSSDVVDGCCIGKVLLQSWKIGDSCGDEGCGCIPRREEASCEEEKGEVGEHHVRGVGGRQSEQEEPAGEIGRHAPPGPQREQGEDNQRRDHEDNIKGV